MTACGARQPDRARPGLRIRKVEVAPNGSVLSSVENAGDLHQGVTTWGAFIDDDPTPGARGRSPALAASFPQPPPEAGAA